MKKKIIIYPSFIGEGSYNKQLSYLVECMNLDKFEVFSMANTSNFYYPKLKYKSFTCEKMIEIMTEKEKEFKKYLEARNFNTKWKKIKYIFSLYDKHPTTTSMSELNKVIVENNIDIFLHIGEPELFDYNEKLKCKSFYIYPCHTNIYPEHLITKLKIWDKVIALCPTVCIDMKRNNIKSSVIPHVIDIKFGNRNKKELRKKYNLPTTGFVILFNAGNYEVSNRKSVDSFFHIIHKYKHKYDKNIKVLYHTGFRGDQNTTLNDMSIITNLNLQDNIVCSMKHIPPQNIIEFYFTCDVFVLPSKAEGFCLPMAEAQYCGMPVITNEFGPMRDYNINGICVKSDILHFNSSMDNYWTYPNIDGFVEAINEVRNWDTYTKMSKSIQGNEFIKSYMSLNSVKKKINDIINY